MCGIVGYSGKKQAPSILVDGLRKLEYRGYDSAGIAVLTADGAINVVKAKGKVLKLANRVSSMGNLMSTCGVGHTRWASHGEPSDINSHPHMAKSGKIALVHNGIIENYLKIKEFLEGKGYEFISETDTEVAVQLVDYFYEGDLLSAVIRATNQIIGSYALGIVCTDFPEQIMAVRRDSPLIVGLGEGENFIASDIPAVLEHTRGYYILDDGEIAVIKEDSVTVYDEFGQKIQKQKKTVDWDIASAEKGGYEHFMIKEIMEQPKAVKDTVMPRVCDGKLVFEGFTLSDDDLKKASAIHIMACGSAYHAGLVGACAIEKLARTPCTVELGSEFRYKAPILNKDDLCIVISQSGETADTIAALREAKRRGIKSIAIVNVMGSTITREADCVLYTHAGPEIAVATTKAYSAQISLLYMLALKLASVKGTIDKEKEKYYLKELRSIPEKIGKMLSLTELMQFYASKLFAKNNMFFIGRGMDYSAAREASLKLKEVSYIHSEAYAAGELKHGTISLIEDGTLVIAYATQQDLFQKMISNIKEVKTRGAVVLSIAMEGNKDIEKVSDYTIYIPKTDPLFTASLSTIPAQLLSYFVSVERGCDVDKPRNLAKSVTIE